MNMNGYLRLYHDTIKQANIYQSITFNFCNHFKSEDELFKALQTLYFNVLFLPVFITAAESKKYEEEKYSIT